MKRQIASIFGVLAITGAIATTTQAATITSQEQPLPIKVNPGNDFIVTLVGSGFIPTAIDAGNPLSGDLKATWDPGFLHFVDFSITNPPWDSGTVISPFTDTANGMHAFQVGDSNNEVSADFQIATYTFNLDIGTPIGTITTIGLNDALVGWFGELSGQITSIPVNYADIDVLAAVPIPAAVWLFGTALAGFGVTGFRRRKVAA